MEASITVCDMEVYFAGKSRAVLSMCGYEGETREMTYCMERLQMRAANHNTLS